MTSPDILLADFRARGFTLTAFDDRVWVSPASELTDADRAVLREYKPGLLALLTNEQNASNGPSINEQLTCNGISSTEQLTCNSVSVNQQLACNGVILGIPATLVLGGKDYPLARWGGEVMSPPDGLICIDTET